MHIYGACVYVHHIYACLQIGRLCITDGASASQLAHEYITHYQLHASLAPVLARIIQERVRTYVELATGTQHVQQRETVTAKQQSSTQKPVTTITRARSRTRRPVASTNKRLLLT